MKYTRISVIIPCFNEESVIYDSLGKVLRYLAANFKTFEVIVVDDGSTDNTLQELRRFRANFPNKPIRIVHYAPNQGKGQAVKRGAMKSQYEVVMFLDADLTIPIEELGAFLPALKEHDILIASRLLPETVFEEKVPWYRRILAKGFRIVQMVILGNFDIPDSQCGFKVFTSEAALRIFLLLQTKRFAFDAEALFLAKRLGFSVRQLPVTVRKDNRESHIRVFRDPLNMLADILRIRTAALLGKYPLKEAFVKAKAEDASA
jgi:dolichyl-phosphate beta-glucosyltransferase